MHLVTAIANRDIVVTTSIAQHIKRDGDDNDAGGGGDNSNGPDETSVHGIVSCVAWLIFIIGAILMRFLKGPNTWLVHASTQSVGLVLWIAGAALGIQLAGSTAQVRPSRMNMQYCQLIDRDSGTKHTQ